MAIAVIIDYSGATHEQYYSVLSRLNLGCKMAPGGIFHAAGPTEDGWRAVDIWESREAFERFRRDAFDEALKEEGMPEPNISVWPIHNKLDG